MVEKEELCKIYLRDLQEGKKVLIQESIPSKWLDLDEPELQFRKEIDVYGEASLVGDYVVVQLEVRAEALLPCTICNGWVPALVELKKLYHAEDLSHTRKETVHYRDLVREAILLELPHLVECGGHCPEREHVKKYFVIDQGSSGGSEDVARSPFAHL